MMIRVEFRKGETLVGVREHDCEIEPANEKKAKAWMLEMQAFANKVEATHWHATLQTPEQAQCERFDRDMQAHEVANEIN